MELKKAKREPEGGIHYRCVSYKAIPSTAKKCFLALKKIDFQFKESSGI
jgi:hypothetical protein